MQMTSSRARRALGVLATAVLTTGAFAAQASAHAKIGPSLVQADSSNAFTLMVPTEGANVTTSSVEMVVPDGFNIGSFEATPGVKRTVVATGTGDEAKVSKVTWTGLKVPEGEGAFLRFSGYTLKPADYVFKVRQTYSDGKVVDWAGPASSDTPAPVVSMVASLGGGGGEDGTDTLTVIALILGGLALLLGLVGLTRRGGRSLT
jgi:uncharacterized protein YcnI